MKKSVQRHSQSQTPEVRTILVQRRGLLGKQTYPTSEDCEKQLHENKRERLNKQIEN